MILPIPFSNGKYFASTDGYIISPSGIFPKKINLLDLRYYPAIYLPVNGEMRAMPLHRAIAITFIPNPENKPHVNHLDKNRRNATVDNLEWATVSENIKHIHKEFRELFIKIQPGDSVIVKYTGEIKIVEFKNGSHIYTNDGDIHHPKELSCV